MEDPGLVLIARADVVLPLNMTYQDMKKEMKSQKIMKYVYTNAVYNAEAVKKNISVGMYNLTKLRRINVAAEYFQQIKPGGCYKMESLEKLIRH